LWLSIRFLLVSDDFKAITGEYFLYKNCLLLVWFEPVCIYADGRVQRGAVTCVQCYAAFDEACFDGSRIFSKFRPHCEGYPEGIARPFTFAFANDAVFLIALKPCAHAVFKKLAQSVSPFFPLFL
jgi:hypothetical protein